MTQQQTIERFKDKFMPEPNSGCWLWDGAQTKAGYGVMRIGGRKGKNKYAHRFSYELYKGPILDGLQIDHLCRMRCCVNPDHLEAVTSAENTKRGNNLRVTIERHNAKQYCKRGHPLFGANIFTTILSNGSRARVCRQCKKLHFKKWYDKNKERGVH